MRDWEDSRGNGLGNEPPLHRGLVSHVFDLLPQRFLVHVSKGKMRQTREYKLQGVKDVQKGFDMAVRRLDTDVAAREMRVTHRMTPAQRDRCCSSL